MSPKPRAKKTPKPKTVVMEGDGCVITPDEIAQGATALAVREPEIVVLDTRKPHEVCHEAMLAKVQEIDEGFIDLGALIEQAHELKVWEYYGHVAPDSYFRDLLRLEPRSWRRLRLVNQAVESLPLPEIRAEAKAALAEVGRHKAGVLAPVFALPALAPKWREWVDQAKKLNEQQLQDAVSAARGLAIKARPGVDADQDFVDYVLSKIATAERERVEKLWIAWQAYNVDLAGGRPISMRAALVMAFDLVQVELGQQAGIEVS